MADFTPGLELNRLFYEEAVRPILSARFPHLAYSAALIGYGSDVLGYDTSISTDHEWGPRLLLFLRDDDHTAYAAAVDDALRRELPPTFRGYSSNFSQPDTSDGGVRHLEPAQGSGINHHVQIFTVTSFLLWELGIPSEDALGARDWLTFPEQKLLEVTDGAVFHDGLGRLIPLRERLRYYPHDVWLYRLSAQWQRISQEEAFVGRTGDVGDDLGSRIVAARLVRDLIHLCFLLERSYAPYSKWLGTAFARLECANELGPHFAATLAAATSQERERHLATAYELVAERQNALCVAEAHVPRTSRYHGPPLHPGEGRPYRVIHAERFANALKAAIRGPDVVSIIAAAGLIGGVDQFTDSTDILKATLCRRLGALYAE